MEQGGETPLPSCGATTTEEKIESADTFSDVEDLKEEGISLPPTREDVHKLLTVSGGKYEGELYLFQANYNSRRTRDGKVCKIDYDEIKRILRKEFNLYKLKSTPGQPFSNSRGVYLAQISGDEKCARVDKLCQQIKQQLTSNKKLNVKWAHIIGSPAVDYGGAAETMEASYSSSTAATTPARQGRRKKRSLLQGQTLMDSYLQPQGEEETTPPSLSSHIRNKR